MAAQRMRVLRQLGAHLCAVVVLLGGLRTAVAQTAAPPGAVPAPAGSPTPGADYPAVSPERALRFPRDYGAHPDYRTEWWYVTGWLTDDAGVERGFQVTFFRVRTRIGEDNPSRFAPRQLMLAHAAVADAASGALRHAERAERALAPLAGAEEGRTHAWIGDWSLEQLPDGRYRTRIDAADFAFELVITPPGEPLANGVGGFSQKAQDPKHASYYYSRPQLEVAGTLRVEEGERRVRGHAWLDHEWSSEILPEGAVGWDWVGINLDDGGSLMAFQMRDKQAAAIWSAMTLAPSSGAAIRRTGVDAVRFTAGRRWRSARTGTTYPVEWDITLADGRRLRLQPLMDDQELDSRRSTGAVYWEGAVRVFEMGAGPDPGPEVGRGYLEMTGYAERLRM